MLSSPPRFPCSHPGHQAAAITVRLGCFCFTPRWLPMLLTLLILPILLSLGHWQLQRAKQKRALLASYQTQTQNSPLALQQLNKADKNWQYRLVLLQGYYDTQHQLLLDNRSYQHQLGYQVLTPFLPEHSKQWILVNRGWLAAPTDRRQLPLLPQLSGLQTVQGLLYFPSKALLLSQAREDQQRWPRRIQALEMASLAKELDRQIYPFVVLLAPQAANGFVRDWQPVALTPAKHIGYAVQWFALALALLIIFLTVNTHRRREHSL